MNKKIAFVLFALVGIGLFALPQTMALFAGQHSFYNIDPTGNQIPCEKCHGDVAAELQTNGASTLTGTPGPHANMKCEFCHRLQIGQSSGDDAFAVLEYQGTATQIANSSKTTTVRRYLVMKVADYESQAYPDNITYNASLDLATGRVFTSGQLNASGYATAGGKFSPLYDTANLSYVNTTWSWSGRSRQTDVINNGVGAVVSIARGTIYPTYQDVVTVSSTGVVTNVSFRDTISVTKDEAFNPTMVNFATQTGATTMPTILLDGAGSRTVNTGSRYHAASLVACMDCHAGASPQPGHETARLGQESADDEIYCFRCHYGTEEAAVNISGTNYSHLRTYELDAGGFGNNLTNAIADKGTAEVHTGFVMQAPNNVAVGAFGGRFTPANNAACIACHTHVDAEIRFTRPTAITFDSNEGTDGNWTIGGYGATGSNTTTG